MYKIIIRSLFYNWLLLFVGLSMGFVLNAEWLGYKSVLIERSINNIFFPIECTPEMESKIKAIGAERIYISLGRPDSFEILGDVVYYNDEFYWCRYKYRDNKGNLEFGESTTRVRWKTWEYYYGSETEIIKNEEKNLSASKKLEEWHSKIREAIKQADKREEELLRQENLSKTQHST